VSASGGPSPGERPAWWPQDDPWPPPDRSTGFPKVLRRLLFLGLGFVVLVIVLSMVAGFFFAERDDRGGPPPFVGLFFLLIIGAAFLFAGRMARRFGNPIGQVMSGLDQLAAGRYDMRVQPSGPPPVRALGEALNTTAARLEAAEEQRRSLVADIAHEVRTPLAVIRGNAEGMLDGVYTMDRDRLATIVDEVEVITRLVEDLNTLSSAESGVLPIHREDADLAEMLRDVAESFKTEAAAKGVTLTVATEPGVAEVDALRIRQVLENLLTNALRHTNAGGEVRLESRSADGALEVSVADTGSGIKPEELGGIFERYRKGPDSTGSGLGLAIAKRLVEAHGGTIRASSTVGKGTIISFSLPRGT
jgi:two-component system sensor histidine kinase BaeS